MTEMLAVKMSREDFQELIDALGYAESAAAKNNDINRLRQLHALTMRILMPLIPKEGKGEPEPGDPITPEQRSHLEQWLKDHPPEEGETDA